MQTSHLITSETTGVDVGGQNERRHARRRRTRVPSTTTREREQQRQPQPPGSKVYCARGSKAACLPMPLPSLSGVFGHLGCCFSLSGGCLLFHLRSRAGQCLSLNLLSKAARRPAFIRQRNQGEGPRPRSGPPDRGVSKWARRGTCCALSRYRGQSHHPVPEYAIAGHYMSDQNKVFPA